MKFTSALLVICLYAVSVLQIPAQTTQETLTNESVVQLTKAGLSNDAIIEKIKSSDVNFDLSTKALSDLKADGVADAVIVQMLKGKTSEADEKVSTTPAITQKEIVIPDGTEVQVELKNNLSGEEVKVGDIVDLTVVSDMEIDGVKVILKGSSATARITTAKKAGYWGRKGQLEWTMQEIQTVNTKIPARFTKSVSGETRSGTVAVGAVVTTVLLGPVGLLWGLKKGKQAVIPAGTKFSIFVDKEAKIKVNTAL